MNLIKNNGKTQQELDIARGLAVIFMVMIHVFVVFSVLTIYDDAPLYSSIVEFLGGLPAAPVFMFILGVGIIYSRNSNSKTLIKRGIKLILTGYLLNILRFLIPAILFYNRYDIFFEIKPLIYETLFVGDILQFAGLTMLFFAAIIKLNFSRIHISFLLVIIAFTNQILPNISGTTLTAPILALFIGGNEQLSFFPFISWIFYPLSGYLFASFLIETRNKNIFYKKILQYTTPATLLYIISMIVFELPTGYETDATYYFQNGFINIIYTIFVIQWIAFIHFISPYFNKYIVIFLNSASKYVSKIYFLHWVLIGIITIYIPRQSLMLNQVLVVTILIYTLTHLLIIISSNLKKEL
jgi:uncharacterized membrane protein